MWLKILLLYCLACHASSVLAQDMSEQDPTVLRAGFFYPSVNQIASRADIMLSLTYWMQEVSQRFDMPVAPVQLFDDIKLMAEAFKQERINLVAAPPLSIAVHFEREDLADCVFASRAGDKLDSLYLVSGPTVVGQGINALRAKHVLMPEHDELAEVFLQLLTLKHAHLPYTKFFAKVTASDKAQKMLLDLFFAKADAAIVNQASYELMTELNPQMAEKIKVLADLPLKSKNYGFLHRNYQHRARFMQNYLKVAETVRGQQILMVYQQEKMSFCDVKDLDTFAALYNEYRQLLKQK